MTQTQEELTFRIEYLKQRIKTNERLKTENVRYASFYEADSRYIKARIIDLERKLNETHKTN